MARPAAETSADRVRPHHHVIIGDGLVALGFLSATRLSPGDRISLIGPQVAHLGRGVAYVNEPTDAEWRYSFLLNSPAEGMGSGFVPWMRERWDSIQAAMRGRQPDWLAAGERYLRQDDIGALNAPRQIYGDYLEALAQDALMAQRQAGIDVHLITGRVAALEPEADRLSLTLEAGVRLQADTVDVATGGPGNQRFKGDDGPFSYAQLFGNETAIAERLRPGVHVCCIGSNATMLDALRLCQTMLPEAEFHLSSISPSGKPPPAHTPSVPRRSSTPVLGGPYETAADFLAAVRREIVRARAAGDGVAEIRGGFRMVFMEQGLAAFLPDRIEARRVTRPLTNWFLGGTRDSIEDFWRLLETGTVSMVRGRVSEVAARNGDATVVYGDDLGTKQELKADIVINCAGPGDSFNFDQLTMSLIRRGWIDICRTSNGLEVGPGCRTKLNGVRHLSPATTVIGDSVQPLPLYDVERLRQVMSRLGRPPDGDRNTVA